MFKLYCIKQDGFVQRTTTGAVTSTLWLMKINEHNHWHAWKPYTKLIIIVTRILQETNFILYLSTISFILLDDFFVYLDNFEMFIFFPVKYVLSRRGKQLLSINGYTFCAQSTSQHKIRWICSTHNNRGCYAVVHTIDSEIVKIKNEHNHWHSMNLNNFCEQENFIKL